ncbi:MAG: hypothetical protein WCP21_22370 [Armatimonadota bacterium]
MKTRTLRVILIVIALLAVVFVMNTVADKRQNEARELAKEAQKAKDAATAAAAAKNSSSKDGHKGAAAFVLPPATGPATAPVKLEVFINNSNTCHEGSVDPMKDLQKVYGKLIRTEWLSTNDPKSSIRADKLKIGCEAGLAVNGKTEAQVERGGGKVKVDFRGPAGDKYKLEDLYLVINNELIAKGKKPPAAAVARVRFVPKAVSKH